MIENAEYSELAHFKAEALKENCHVYEGSIPIQWFKLLENKVIVGCIGLLCVHKKPVEARIRGWYLIPSLRNKGYGKLLIQHAMGQAEKLGFQRMECKTRYGYILLPLGWFSTGKTYPSWNGEQYKYLLVNKPENPLRN